MSDVEKVGIKQELEHQEQQEPIEQEEKQVENEETAKGLIFDAALDAALLHSVCTRH